VYIDTGVIFKPRHFQCVKNFKFKAMHSRRVSAIYPQNTNATFCKIV